MTDNNNQSKDKAITPYMRLRTVVQNESTIKRFADAFGGSEKRAMTFLSNVLTVASGNPKLLECKVEDLLQECMQAATMDLPINESLGFACIIPYAGKPQFQPMKNGYVQLALRTHEYEIINTGEVYEGQEVINDQLTGKVTIIGERDKNKPVTHYFNYFRKKDGYEHCLCWSIDEIKAWGKRWNPSSYANPQSLWNKNFPAMAKAKVTKLNLKWYGELDIYSEEEDKLENRFTPPLPSNGIDPLTVKYDEEPATENTQIIDATFNDVTEPETVTTPAPAFVEDQTPPPATEQPKQRGKKANSAPVEDPRIAALVNERVVQNSEDAVALLGNLKLAANMPVVEVVKFAKGFIGWKEGWGATDEQALKYMNEGKLPG